MSLKRVAEKPKKSKRAWYTSQPTKNAEKKPPSFVQSQMNTIRRIPSDFLAAKPSFASGFARRADFGCAFDPYKKTATPQEAGFCATLADWMAVGLDILEPAAQVSEKKKIA